MTLLFPEPGRQLQELRPPPGSRGSPSEPFRAEAPHLLWPFRLVRNSADLAFVEQDLPREIAQCVALVLTANPGDFPDEPELGVEELELQMNGASEAAMTDAISRWEPRAEVEYPEDEVRLLAQRIVVAVESEEQA